MVKFNELGFNTLDEYANSFLSSFLPSNKTYTYFVNWDKVKNNVNRYINEISLLNSLTKIDDDQREYHLRDLLRKYPQVVEVIPMLLAERAKNGRIDIFDEKTEEIVSFNFNKSAVDEENITRIIDFCYKTRVMELFSEIHDLQDYLIGTEVGLDTNARKNRSGTTFEKIVQQKISKLLDNNIYHSVYHDRSFSLYPVISPGRNKGKIHDITVYKNNVRVLIIECSFYNGTGSKPTSIAEGYPEMSRAAREQGIAFLWVTDGIGWNNMKEPIIRSIQNIDWVLNYKMLGLIHKILQE